MYRYYYEQLSSKLKNICNNIVAKLFRLERTITIFDSTVSSQDIFDIFKVIDKDFPEIFYIDIKRHPLEISVLGLRKKISVTYLYSHSEILQYRSKLYNVVKSISVAVEKYDTQEQRERIVYNSILKNVTYNASAISLTDYTIIGPFIHHKAICEGYAKAFKFLCDAISLKCLIVSGNAYNSLNNLNEGHAWNIITHDDRTFYHVDVTWDSIRYHKNIQNYLYYNIGDSDMANDHGWDRNEVPMCMNNAILESSIELSTIADIETFLLKMTANKKTNFSFVSRLKFKSTQDILSLLQKILYKYSGCEVKNIFVLYTKERHFIECNFEYW